MIVSAAVQLGRRLIAETPPLPDVPDGPFLMKQEALPSMTGMIPVPLQDRVGGVPANSDGELRQSGSSSQGALAPGPDASNLPCAAPCFSCAYRGLCCRASPRTSAFVVSAM